MIPAAAKTVLARVAEWSVFLVVFGTGSTYWINTEVERRMEELVQDPGNHPAVVQLQTEVKYMKDSQVRIEAKVDTFSAKFLEYLERQAQ